MLKKFIDEIAVIYSMATMPLRWLEGRGYALRYLRKTPKIKPIDHNEFKRRWGLE